MEQNEPSLSDLWAVTTATVYGVRSVALGLLFMGTVGAPTDQQPATVPEGMTIVERAGPVGPSVPVVNHKIEEPSTASSSTAFSLVEAGIGRYDAGEYAEPPEPPESLAALDISLWKFPRS